MKHTTLTMALALSCLSTTVVATEMAKYPNSNSISSTKVQKKQSDIYIISNRHVNRIVTPFKHPSIKLDNVGGVAYKTKENVLYLSTTSDQPVGGFITDKFDESVAIKVMFKPVPSVSQEIILNDAQTNSGSMIARKFERASPRTDTIKEVMATLAKGGLPLGYTSQHVNGAYLPSCNQNGLKFDFFNGQFVSGGDYVVSIGVMTNDSSQPIELKENNCYKDGVVSVAAYPSPQLLPSEKSEVYVMFYRNKPVSQAAPQRRSLLGGDNE